MIIKYTYLPITPLWQDMTRGQFLKRGLIVLNTKFPSPRLVVSPRLEKPVCPTIYPQLEGE